MNNQLGIVEKRFSAPDVVRVRKVDILNGADGNYFNVTGPEGAIRLKLTKPLTIINAQGKEEEIPVGAVLPTTPKTLIGGSNSYEYTTEGKVYVLTIGVNAELYNSSSSEKSDTPKNQAERSLPFYIALGLVGYLTYKIIKG